MDGGEKGRETGREGGLGSRLVLTIFQLIFLKAPQQRG